MSTPDVLVIGGGIIGLYCAWELKRRDPGLEVLILERGQLGREASWAAAGMLEPHFELQGGPVPAPGSLRHRFFELCTHSRTLHAERIEELESGTGRSCGHRTEGLLEICPRSQRAARLEWFSDLGEPAEVVSRKAFHEREPQLRPPLEGLLLPQVHQVEPRQLLSALATACRQQGVEIREQSPVERLKVDGPRLSGVVSSGETVTAGHYLLCAGAWASRFEALRPFLPPVKPARGQILVVRMPRPDTLSHILHYQGLYFVPRRNGHLLIGSTVEDVGFEKGLEPETARTFLAALAELVQSPERFPVVGGWSGLRPRGPDPFPILGPTPLENLTLATAHFRSGILLSAITAELVAEQIVDGHLPEAMLPFTLERFGAVATPTSEAPSL